MRGGIVYFDGLIAHVPSSFEWVPLDRSSARHESCREASVYLIPAALMRAALVRISALTCASSWAGVMTIGSRPSVASLFSTLGVLRACDVSRWSVSTIWRGVLAGTNDPYQSGYSASATPASASVGTSGRMAARLGLF